MILKHRQQSGTVFLWTLGVVLMLTDPSVTKVGSSLGSETINFEGHVFTDGPDVWVGEGTSRKAPLGSV